MSLLIGLYINHALSGVTGVTSVQPLVAITGSSTYIVYKRRNEVPEYSRDGCDFNTTSVQIDIMADDYNTSIDTAELVRKALENVKDTAYGIQTANLTSADEQTDGTVFIQTLNFEFVTD